ncbi:uncharacterized protein J7T55_003211 [Diaporthe amygdali]|uniref:uncharacterized protein n=1 Tax=Phomopsis amygdali TaxID=1214568 RepID=UPI0022FED0AB|nr:uncharacterized protein J7T55_003211 [Diaporthe amygdali]KAJ0122695.1 uncharacterized protein J7T55_003211 [Diaporthe amygdali]
MALYEAETNVKLMPWQSSYVDQARLVHDRQAHQLRPNDGRWWEEVPNFDIVRNKKRGFLHPAIDSRRQIRVLKIPPEATTKDLVCEYDIVDFDGASSNSYFALSYTWGSATGADDVHDIFILNDSKQRVPFCVRRNVWELLTSGVVRKKLSGHPIYIDAICINQLDNDEKGHQIQLMQSVYSQALEVIIWLGSSIVNAEDDSNLQSLQDHGDWVWAEKRAMTAGAGVGIGGNSIDAADKQKLATILESNMDYTGDYACFGYQHNCGQLHISMVTGRQVGPVIDSVVVMAPGFPWASLDEHDIHKFYAMLSIVEEDIRKDIVPDYRLGVHEVYTVALAAGFRSIKAHLRDSLKMRLEAFGILAAHLHEAFGLREVDICDVRAAVLAAPYIHENIQSDLMEARLLEDETGLRYRRAKACRSNHAPNSSQPHCLLTGLIQAPDSSSSSVKTDEESGNSQDPVSNLSLAIHIRAMPVLHGSGKGDGDMYWMVESPHGSYTAAMHIRRKTDGSDGWTVSYEDAIPKPHHSTCDHCEKPIVAMRQRCLQCLDFDLCSPCMKEAGQSKDEHVDQHHFEAIYHPASSLSHTTNPLRYLALNFRRVPYRMHPGIFEPYLHDPDQSAAVLNYPACGIMFPWSPREGVWPPYWVANLDIMTWTPADEGVPHIRCMGLRLRDSDPTDRPPSPMPGGYRFFGQIQLCAIRQQVAIWASSFSPPVELSPNVNLVDLVDRRLKEREAMGNEIARGGEIILMLALPPVPRTDGVESDNVIEEDGVWGLRLPRSCRPGEDQNDVPTAPVMCFWTADDFDDATIAKMKADAGRQLKLLPVKANVPTAERQWVTFRCESAPRYLRRPCDAAVQEVDEQAEGGYAKLRQRDTSKPEERIDEGGGREGHNGGSEGVARSEGALLDRHAAE